MFRFLRHILLLQALLIPNILSAQAPIDPTIPELSETIEITELTEKPVNSEGRGSEEDPVSSENPESEEGPVSSESPEITPDPPSLKSLKPTSNPVDYDREAPEQPVLHYYDKHGDPLETPVRFLAVLDTVTKIKAGPVYRTFNGISVSANFFDGIMMIIGQQRASFDLAVDCSIHNWFFPVIETGIGFASAHPDDGRCHFKLKATPYVKIGMNYNFLYKSNPDYQFFLGLRAGWSTFGYDIYSIQPGSQYYISDGPSQVTGLRSTTFYGQALAGLKVRLWRGLFMGWSFRYGFNIHRSYSDTAYPAWFTPGYGTSPIAATFSIGWRFGSNRPVQLTEELPAP